MKFASRPDGKHHPITPSKGGISSHTFQAVASQDKHRHRMVSKKEKARLTSLENPMLYHNLKEKLEKLNPHIDIESLIDRTLEPEEALNAIKKAHPEIRISENGQDTNEDFRQFLSDLGIDNTRVQNLIAMNEKPLDENELGQVSYALNGRPDHAVKVDKSMKAPITNDIRKWAKHPNRFDIRGLDTRQ